MIYYFSGTGNSKYCAQMLADKLEDKLIDSFNYIRDGISAELIDARVLKPFDRRTFEESALRTGLVFVAEDNVGSGGFGSCIEELFADRPQIRVHKIAWPDEFVRHGTQAQLEKKYGMDAESVAERVREVIERTT